MRSTLKTGLLPAALAVLVATAACSKDNSGTSPLAPTPVTTASAAPPPAAATLGATINGVVLSGSQSAAGLSWSALTSSVTSATTGGKYTISVSGTGITVVSGDDGRFVLENVPPGTLTLQISGNGVSAQVTVANVEINEQVRVTVRVNGGSAEIEEEEQIADGRAEVEGRISAVNGTTIVVGSRQVVVPAGTPIRHGGTARAFSDLVPGVRVHVKATRAGEVLTAMEVNLQNENITPSSGKGGSSDDDEDTELSGAIVGTISGSCPAITFTIGTTVVKTNASTKFDDVRCASLATGDIVEVEGTKQPDGSLLASELEKKSATDNDDDDEDEDDDDADEAEVSGTIAGAIGGSCPNLTFTVGTTVVKTNSSTKFDSVTCSTLATGNSVKVEGAKQGDGSILASEVEKKSESSSSSSSSKNGKR
jgi:hypothetical protein